MEWWEILIAIVGVLGGFGIMIWSSWNDKAG